MKAARVLLADDHAIVNEGLQRVLEPEFQIVGRVADGLALVEAVAALRPDIVISDISMPLLNGIDAARQIRKANRKVQIIFFTMYPDVTYAAEAMCAGGSGYVLKTSASDEILAAIREVRKGRIYLTPSIDRLAVEAQMKHAGMQPKLTSRQREVLRLITEGRSSREIGEILHVSARTIEFHKYRMMEHLGLHTTGELIHYALTRGLLLP
jgi:DNA-binding NarL/FixJ family response regulator